MPYVVTHRIASGTLTLNRRAVATLGEARDYIHERTGREYTPSDVSYDRICALTDELGGTIGPLPDGTVIEAERVSWAELRERAGVERNSSTIRMTLDTFNAAQESS